MSGYWRPALSRWNHRQRPNDGELIAVGRKPWRVVEIREVDPQDWGDDDRQRWMVERMPDPWRSAPYELILEELSEGKRYGAVVRPTVHYDAWQPLDEHYAVCNKCGELAPCRERGRAEVAEREMKRAEKQMQVMPGCCPACNEPITSRQKTIDFPGSNVVNPFAADNPVFHTRRKCLSGAAAYERAWVAADPARPRSLLTLYCEGSVVVHGDGSAECHGAEDCPTVHARHRSYAACYWQAHGCPKECARTGHPGTRIAGSPKGLRP